MAEDDAPPPMRVRLELVRAAPIDDEALDILAKEAAAVWGLHGVAVSVVSATPARGGSRWASRP